MPQNDCGICNKLINCAGVLHSKEEFQTLIAKLLCEGIDSFAELSGILSGLDVAAILARLDALEADVAAAEAAIIVNAGDIVTNAGNIASNAADIVSLDGRVTALEGAGVSTFNWSTTEQVWPFETTIGGDPLYAKAVAVAALPNATGDFHNHGITNLDRIFYYWGEFSNGTILLKVPYVGSSVAGSIDMFVNATQFRLNTGTNYSAWSGYVFLIYSKTGD